MLERRAWELDGTRLLNIMEIDPALACAARRLLQAPSPRPLHIACFGTSITKGDFRVREQDAYPHVLRKLLRARFPSASPHVTSHGYPGASPQYLHACLDRMLPRADLYVVEHFAGHRYRAVHPQELFDGTVDEVGLCPEAGLVLWVAGEMPDR